MSEDEGRLGERVRRVRRSRDLTQEELGKQAGMSPVTISRLEKGHYTEIYASTVRELARHLRVSADYLLGLSQDNREMTWTSAAEDPATPPPPIPTAGEAPPPRRRTSKGTKAKG